ncbi:hypothetical protein [Parafrankia discariae]|uniref:hypothetical protein n=1 Tax=Parafrankia discariae TaxID=365528 RepID=UPI001E47AA73|nr:hypothetical protein [Parafrankia discariae]
MSLEEPLQHPESGPVAPARADDLLDVHAVGSDGVEFRHLEGLAVHGEFVVPSAVGRWR